MKSKKTKVVRWEHGNSAQEVNDFVAAEEPLEIRVDTQTIAITMRTPGHDEELAAGFLLSEGLIHHRSEVARIAPLPKNRQQNVVDVFLANDVSVKLPQVKRRIYVSSSCGLCGKESIDSVHQHFKPVADKSSVSVKVLLELPNKLRAAQSTFDQTGGLHAAAIVDLHGNLIVAREDVGRHNAVDKVIGRCFLDGILPLSNYILMVSGRASFEIMQKALAARIAIVCAVSAPSSLAVEFARKSRQTLVGFLRENKMNVYANPRRVRFG